MSNSRLPRPFATVVGSGLALVGAGLGLLYLVPDLQATSTRVAQLSSFIPYGLIPWALAVLVLLSSARGSGRLVALVPLAGLLAHSLVLVPYFEAANTAGASTPATLRLVTLNLHYGQADTIGLLNEVERIQPDIVVLTEFTPQAETVLANPRWTKLLPYHLGTTGESSSSRFDGDSSGTQVLSRTPISELGRTEGTTATNLAVSVEANGHKLVLLAVHPVNPVRGGVDGWLKDALAVNTLAAQYANQPLVVAGDLNSVPEHLTLRKLMATTGLHEATQGWQPTYPADRLVPLITIDHVLATAEFQTVRVSRFAVSGTDHLGSVVELTQS